MARVKKKYKTYNNKQKKTSFASNNNFQIESIRKQVPFRKKQIGSDRLRVTDRLHLIATIRYYNATCTHYQQL